MEKVKSVLNASQFIIQQGVSSELYQGVMKSCNSSFDFSKVDSFTPFSSK